MTVVINILSFKFTGLKFGVALDATTIASTIMFFIVLFLSIFFGRASTSVSEDLARHGVDYVSCVQEWLDSGINMGKLLVIK